MVNVSETFDSSGLTQICPHLPVKDSGTHCLWRAGVALVCSGARCCRAMGPHQPMLFWWATRSSHSSWSLSLQILDWALITKASVNLREYNFIFPSWNVCILLTKLLGFFFGLAHQLSATVTWVWNTFVVHTLYLSWQAVCWQCWYKIKPSGFDPLCPAIQKPQLSSRCTQMRIKFATKLSLMQESCKYIYNY